MSKVSLFRVRLQRWIVLILLACIGIGLAVGQSLTSQSALATISSFSFVSPQFLSGAQRREHSSLRGNGYTAQSFAPAQFYLKAHSLPASLVKWQDPKKSGDYFDQIKPVSVGYLVWSEFPITVYIEPVSASEAKYPFAAKRAVAWIKVVSNAVQEWNQYLPLKVVGQAEGADITILRSSPPIRLERENSESSGNAGESNTTLPISRARTAETRFELYTKLSSSGKLPILAHRFIVVLRPDQATSYLQATARHELGHALGIWGHSPLKTDALYFSQVRNSPLISNRDVNTLKRVYEQPTRLGWPLLPE